MPTGQLSSAVLVTNLVNRVQPLIRYKMGDWVTISPDRLPVRKSIPGDKRHRADRRDPGLSGAARAA